MARWRFRNGPFEARRTRSIVGLVCVGLMLVAVNIIAAHCPPVRLDLTEERLYTLSRGTLRTLGGIDEPITLRFYYSARRGEAMPAYRAYAQRVRELLDRYVAAANGKLRLEIYRPRPFSEAADSAASFGLRGVPLGTRGEPVYFGLAGANSTDDQQVIPFFAPQRERLLEYDVTRLVHTLAYPKRVALGLISGPPAGGDPIGPSGRPDALLRELRQVFDVETLPSALDTVPAATDVLMLVQPRGLPERTLFAIDQFVLRGGGAVVFADPHSELEARGGRPGATPDSGVARLFEAWGIRLLPETAAAGFDLRRDALNRDALNRDDPITANLRRITMASAGIIEPREGAATIVKPLITTPPAKSDGRRYVLAARITGPVETAFPDFPAKEEPARSQSSSPAGLRRSVEPANLVVVADTDLLDPGVWARSEDLFGLEVLVPIANNADFVANAIEALAGQDVIDLRGRGISARPFTLLAEMPRQDAERLKAILAFVNIALVPILVAAMVIGVAMTRRRRRRAVGSQ